jgi:NAD(P)-dependent dehydrogenase (short-subunit alcohol dehydrogenase family)
MRDKVVVITGASSGVGRATARALAEPGISIALLARGRDGLDAAAEEVGRAGARPLVLPVDVSDALAVDAAAERIDRELGAIDVWINSAMVSVFSFFMDMTDEEFSRVTEVTYLGTVNGTRAALRQMLPRDRGTIVQVGSALAYRGIPLQSAYCGAKHAVQGFTESVRCELMHKGSHIHLTMVQLPALNTPQFDVSASHLSHRPQPVPPIYDVDVATRAVVWASRHRRREVWVGGTTVATLVANDVASGVLDGYLARTAIDAQQTQDGKDPSAPSNLWESPPGDRGARGRFRDRSHHNSIQWWLSTHRTSSALIASAVGALALAKHRRRREGLRDRRE